MELVRYFTDRGNKMAIICEKRKTIHAVMMHGAGLKVTKISKDERRCMTPVEGLKKAAKQFRKFGKLRGSTKQARLFLRGV